MQVQEGSLVLSFEDGARVEKYDESGYFTDRFSHTAGGSKGVDAVCLARGTCWLIEIKEVRRSLWEDHDLKVKDAIRRAAVQVRDTLAGLTAARLSAEGEERRFAASAVSAAVCRVVVHLDQRDTRQSRLRPTAISLASVQSKLRKTDFVGAIDPRALAVDTGDQRDLPWRATTAGDSVPGDTDDVRHQEHPGETRG
jgi:hypothetical protein